MTSTMLRAPFLCMSGTNKPEPYLITSEIRIERHKYLKHVKSKTTREQSLTIR